MAHLPVQLPPYSLCLRLDPFDRVYQYDSAVYDPTSTLDLHAKVSMARSVNQVE